MIEVDEVGVTAGDVTLLAPVSVVAQRGEALVVRGRNGTGKSTLLRVLAGARKPSSGAVRIDGEAVVQRDRGFRRRVAAMIGLPPMAPDLTVFDHVLLVATTWPESLSGCSDSSRGAATAASAWSNCASRAAICSWSSVSFVIVGGRAG